MAMSIISTDRTYEHFDSKLVPNSRVYASFNSRRPMRKQLKRAQNLV